MPGSRDFYGLEVNPQGRVDAQTEALFRVVHAHTLAKAGLRTAAAALAEVRHARTLLEQGSQIGDEVSF